MAGLVAGTGKTVGMITQPSLYHGHGFPDEIISHAVWPYLCLSEIKLAHTDDEVRQEMA
jgi:hypothetical protein